MRLCTMIVAALAAGSSAAIADQLADFQTKVDGLWAEATLEAAELGVAAEPGSALKEGASIGAACLGSQITACVEWWGQLEAIATATGWRITEYDGKIDVATWNEQLTRAAQAGHDGVLVFGGVPSLSGPGLAALADSGVPLVGMTSDDPEGVVHGFDTRLDGGIQQDNFEIGYLQGVAAYKIGGGKVHGIGGYDGSEISVARREGLEAFIGDCTAAGGDCSLNLRQTDTAQMFQQIGQYCAGLALANPSFNVAFTQVDDLTAICLDEIESAGLLKDGDIGVGVDFNSIGVSRISENGAFVASVAAPYPSGAWQGVDELNRLINGGSALPDRPWVKGIFYIGNLDLLDTQSGAPWDVQIFRPEIVFSEAWGLTQ